MEALQKQQAARLAQGVGPLAPSRSLLPPGPPLPDHRTLQAPEGALGEVGTEEEEDAEDEEEGEEARAEEEAAEENHPGAQGPSSPSSQPPGLHPHEWTYEEQFKQVGPTPSMSGPLPYLPLLAKAEPGDSSLCKMKRDTETRRPRERQREDWRIVTGRERQMPG